MIHNRTEIHNRGHSVMDLLGKIYHKLAIFDLVNSISSEVYMLCELHPLKTCIVCCHAVAVFL